MTAANPIGGSTVREELSRRYELPQRLRKVEALLADKAQDPAWVLRSHIEKPIGHSSALERDNLDEFLAGVSLLFIAGSGSVGFDVEGVEAGRVKSVLNHRDVRRYYEKHYPIAVPVLARAELNGELDRAFATSLDGERQSDKWPDRLLRFVALDSIFLMAGPMSDFLSLLDDYKVRGQWLGDLRRALKSQRILAEWLESSEKRTIIEGMQEFFEFSDDFDDLLTSMENLPLGRGLFWLHFGYWYGAGGNRMRDVAALVVNSIAQVTSTENEQSQYDLKSAFQRLTDFGNYPRETMGANMTALTRWKKHATSN